MKTLTQHDELLVKPYIDSKIQTLTNQVKDMNNVYGSKNLLPLTKRTGGTQSGVTFTVNGNGSITVNGTATSGIGMNETVNKIFLGIIPKGEYLISCKKDKTTVAQAYYTITNGVSNIPVEEDKVLSLNSDTTLNMWIYVSANVTYDNVTFYPMIRLASITDSTYQPYAKTNQQLTAENGALTNAFANNVNVNGSKNLLVLTSYSIGETVTLNQGTVKANDDGSYTINGTFSADASYKVDWLKSVDRRRIDIIGLAGKEVIASCKGSPNSNIQLYTGCFKTDGTASQAGTGGYGDVERTWTMPNDAYTFRNWISIAAGSYSNVTIYPMVRLATDDSSFAIPSKTNIQLTEDTTTLLDNTEVNGAVNMIYPNGVTNVTAGITYTLNDDNSLSVVGTPSGGSGFQYVNINASEYVGKTLKFKANPSGKYADARFYIALICRATLTSANLFRTDLQLGGSNYQDEYTFTVPNGTGVIIVGFNMASDATSAINLTFKPMITVPSYNGDYAPYAKSNKELTEDVKDIVKGGAYVYQLPDYFYHIVITATKESGQYVKLITPHGDVKAFTSSNAFNANSINRQKILLNDNADTAVWTYSISGLTLNLNCTGHLVGWIVSNYPLTFTTVNTSTPEANTLDTLNLALLSNS